MCERDVCGIPHLLEKQFGSVRNRELCHLFRAFAIRAPAVVAHEAAFFAGVDLELVGGYHEPFEQQLRGAVTDQAVSFHLAKPQATFARAALGWLPGQGCAWSPDRYCQDTELMN